MAVQVRRTTLCGVDDAMEAINKIVVAAEHPFSFPSPPAAVVGPAMPAATQVVSNGGVDDAALGPVVSKLVSTEPSSTPVVAVDAAAMEVVANP